MTDAAPKKPATPADAAASAGHSAPVVLLHSGGMSSRQWRKLAGLLAPAHRVEAPDFLGSGERPPFVDDGRFTLASDVDPIAALVASLGAPVHLVGHSYGGLVALLVAARAPSRVRSVAVYEPVAFGLLHAAGDREGLDDLRRAEHPGFDDERTGGDAAWMERFIDYWNGPGAFRALPDASRAAFLQSGRKVFREVTTLMRDRTPPSTYALVHAPTLVLYGERTTPAARRVAAHLRDALPHATLREVPGAGHMGPLTHADAVNAAIVAHIREADPHAH